MANSAPELRQELLDAVGVDDPEELFVQIPADHRLQRPLNLPPALTAEADLQRHLTRTLSRNVDCETALSFLGGGVWQHHVPAVCDEIAQRTEFVTSEWGTPASDHGRNQAWFEFASQLGELLELDFVGLPVYSWGCAAGHAIRMANRITQRTEVLVQDNLEPERAAVIRTYCEPPEMPSHITVTPVKTADDGRIDLDDLRSKLNDNVAALYLETPNSLGVIERNVEELVHDAGAELILGVDPISLGVLAPPGQLNADIAVGSTQPLGVHMNCGGGAGGFIASRDEERYARAYPTLQVSIAPDHPGGRARLHDDAVRAVLVRAPRGRQRLDRQQRLPVGDRQRRLHVPARPAGIPRAGRAHPAAQPLRGEPHRRAAERQRAPPRVLQGVRGRLRATGRRHQRARCARNGIFGGGAIAPNSALYCVTEVHAQEDIDRLVEALAEVTA